jgi:hypothetical protein
MINLSVFLNCNTLAIVFNLLQASEDEYPEREECVKHMQQRQQSHLILDAVRCHTPVNVASECPPVLDLPELKRERMLLYHTPPHINPGFCFDSAAVKIKARAGKYVIGIASFVSAKFIFK